MYVLSQFSPFHPISSSKQIKDTYGSRPIMAELGSLGMQCVWMDKPTGLPSSRPADRSILFSFRSLSLRFYCTLLCLTKPPLSYHIIDTMSGALQKITVQNPVVELDGDEMTRIIWKKIREEVRHFFWLCGPPSILENEMLMEDPPIAYPALPSAGHQILRPGLGIQGSGVYLPPS